MHSTSSTCQATQAEFENWVNYLKIKYGTGVENLDTILTVAATLTQAQNNKLVARNINGLDGLTIYQAEA